MKVRSINKKARTLVKNKQLLLLLNDLSVNNIVSKKIYSFNRFYIAKTVPWLQAVENNKYILEVTCKFICTFEPICLGKVYFWLHRSAEATF